MPPIPPNHLIYIDAILLTLDYINYGNGDSLMPLKHRARHWCEKYYKTIFFQSSNLQPVVYEHPHLFHLHEPSLSRLDKRPDTCYVTEPPRKDGKTNFPEYTEPLLLDDNELWLLLNKVDESVEWHMGVEAKDLMGSPILYYMPAVLSKIATLDLTMSFASYASSVSDSSGSPGISPLTLASSYGSELSELGKLDNSKARRFGWAALSSWAQDKLTSINKKSQSVELGDIR